MILGGAAITVDKDGEGLHGKFKYVMALNYESRFRDAGTVVKETWEIISGEKKPDPDRYVVKTADFKARRVVGMPPSSRWDYLQKFVEHVKSE